MKKYWRLMTVFIVGAVCFFGGALYAVYNGQQENEGICDAVNGLRKDLTEVLNSQRGRAEQNAKKLGLSTAQLNKDYNEMLSKIGDPKCP